MNASGQSTKPFRKLQWRLTLSYTLVTVAALIVVELLLLGGLFIVLNSDFLSREIVDVVRSDFVPQASAYLEPNPPDLDGLNRWLQSQVSYSTSSATNTRRISQGLSIQFDQNYQLFVIDPDGILLAKASDGHLTPAVGSSFDASAIPELASLLPAVLSGSDDIERYYDTTPDGELVMAFPIDSLDGDLRGAFVASIEVPAFNIRTLGSLALLIGLSLIPITITAGVIGTIFGFLTARNLTRRLENLSVASDAWSRGDFSVVAEDRSDDELGQLSHHLNVMAEQLENLLQQQQEVAGLEERSRIARELHDSVKQQVFATTMQVAAARKKLPDDVNAAVEHLIEAEKISLQSQEELATLIQELRPRALDDDNLTAAVKGFAGDWSRRTGIKAAVQVRGDRPLDSEIEQALFRVAQEALANVNKHSGAGQVDLELHYSPESVSLTIADDGHGFNQGKTEEIGYGLQSMRERVERLGGRLTIESAPGKGTKLLVDIPERDQEA